MLSGFPVPKLWLESEKASQALTAVRHLAVRAPRMILFRVSPVG